MRIGFVMMLIATASAFAVWLPRRNMLAVLIMDGKVSDDDLRYRVEDVLREWMPFSISGRTLPWLERNSGWLSTDDRILCVELPDSDVSLTAMKRLRNFRNLTGVSVYPRHLGPTLAPLASIETLDFVWIDGLQPESDLGELKQLPQLVFLWISKPSAIGGGWKNLQDLPRLKTLGLDAASSCSALRGIESAPSLEALVLQNSVFQDDDFQSLSGCTRLSLFRTQGSSAVGATGLRHLARCTSLETLSMSCSANDDELQVLAELRNLKRLEVRGSNISPEGIDRLGRALPECAIVR